ncbi:MAG TPA: alpha-amylase family glycosyl hydrolase, partial [bacterium]|nr:alpha-amylase family glycosyl hydrolase [bacterium]
YEVHPKGFTKDPSSAVTHPGTFAGIGEKAGYFSDLGVNAVELLPVHEKPLDGGYWGYWTENFFAPEITYTATRDPLQSADEFREMVDRLHQQGVEVILDVVFNHTGEGGLWRDRVYTDDVLLDPSANGSFYVQPKEITSLYSFRGLDNAGYYALSTDNQTFWNNAGVGNDSRDNFQPMRKLIVDSLRYYVDEMHVDGFRFDEAGILGEKDLDYNDWDDPNHTVLGDIVNDPELQKYNTRLVVEPWSAGGNYGSLIGAYPAAQAKPGTGFGEWNGRFRDWWRSFTNIDTWTLNTKEAITDAGFALTGSHDYYAWNGRKPYHSVNFVTCHDGFTMYDLVSYDHKENACGPLNPVCCTDPSSPWCETHDGADDNRSRDWGAANEATKRQLMRDFFTAMMVSEGTPMILGGDEWLRTQYGNNNAYSTGADNEWNWFRWGDWQAYPERQRMHDFVRAVIRLRKEHEYAFAPADWGGAHFVWNNAAGAPMADADWAGRKMAMYFNDDSAGPELYVIFNFDRAQATFTLPAGKNWAKLIDTQQYFDNDAWFTQNGGNPLLSANANLDTPVPITGGSYLADQTSIVVLEAQP